MAQETFVNHRGFLWFWVIFSGVIALTVWYFVDQPVAGRSGSSFYGYTSGILSAAAILLLTWFGIRKRSYTAHLVTLKGWLAFHIWLGIALLIVVPLHAAFEFDFNVHTYAYAAMCVVVLSGIFGTYFYRALPLETISNRGGGALSKRYQEIEICDKQISDFISQKGEHPGRYTEIRNAFDLKLNSGFMSHIFLQNINALDPSQASAKISGLQGDERNQAVQLLSLLANKRKLVQSVAKEKTVLFKLKAWLFFHVPFTILLLVLLFVHIFSVFYFR